MLHKIRRFCEGVLGRKLSLENIHQRCKIHVHGTLTSPNTVSSPLSPVKSAVLTHCLIRQSIYTDRNGHSHTDYHPFNIQTDLGDLIIQTAHGTVLVPGEDLQVEYAVGLDRNPQEIMGKPPEHLRKAIENTHSQGTILYNERYISSGEKVALRAVVEPTNRGQGAYRAGVAATDFVVIADTEVPALREIEVVTF